MSLSLLMPQTADLKALGLDYASERRWWGKYVAKTKRLGRKKHPEPGELPIVDPENG